MEAVILPKAQFEAIIGAIREIPGKLEKKKKASRIVIDNAEFLQLMQISDRTARTWRAKKLIHYTKLGKKIYYKMEDLEALLTKHYISK